MGCESADSILEETNSEGTAPAAIRRAAPGFAGVHCAISADWFEYSFEIKSLPIFILFKFSESLSMG